MFDRLARMPVGGNTSEDTAVATLRGKWSQAGVPHKGWRCVDVDDRGEANQICDMCESQPVRFVHHMEHDDYPDILKVGCVCAGHMEENLEGAQRRDKAMASRAGKRARWLQRQWRVSAKGNEWLRADGYRVVVYRKGNQWAATIAAEDDDFVHHGRRTFPTSNEVKLAAFDFISRLLASKAPRR
jgi:hypothetical protein